jgi:hypothetical protein
MQSQQMTTEERCEMRQALLDKGFTKFTHMMDDVDTNHAYYDQKGYGSYTEVWKHRDGSIITLAWGPKEVYQVGGEGGPTYRHLEGAERWERKRREQDGIFRSIEKVKLERKP